LKGSCVKTRGRTSKRLNVRERGSKLVSGGSLLLSRGGKILVAEEAPAVFNWKGVWGGGSGGVRKK